MTPLPEDDDPDYFVKRAETQLELAQRSAHPAAVAAHYAMANCYLERETAPPEKTAND